MQIYKLDEITRSAVETAERYSEFLRVPHLSMGLYRLRAGEKDPQRPHLEDEVYYVLSGRAQIRVKDEVHAVEPGSIIYVGAQAPHKFIHIEEDLEILVFFAPAESS